MELTDAMRTQNACRYYLPDPVPDAVFHRAIEAARFAPNGGNRCAVRFVVVRDPAKRRRLGELYLPLWREVSGGPIGDRPAEPVADGESPRWLGFSNIPATLRAGDDFAERFGEHPAVIVVCVDLRDTHPTDAALDRRSIVSGASVYPMAQNLCLALRDQGVATTFTTLLVAREPEVKALLGIPDELATACHIVAGYPAKGFPRRLRRPPVEQLAFADAFGAPLTAPAAEGPPTPAAGRGA